MDFLFIAVFLVLFNTLDGIFTIILINTGIAYEVNPIMRNLMLVSPWMFLFFKLVVVNGLVLTLGYALLKDPDPRKISPKIALSVCCSIYALIIVQHIRIAAMLP